MLYPSEIESKIGFTGIRSLLVDRCLSDMGEKSVSRMQFSHSFEEVKRQLSETNELIEIIKEGIAFPSSNYFNTSEYVRRIKVPGTFLNVEELFSLHLSLITIYKILSFFEQNSDSYPNLYALSIKVDLKKNSLPNFEDYLTTNGELRNDASTSLMTIRRKILKAESASRNKLNSILKQAKKDSFISSDVSLTLRSGRMVIPIAAEHKRKIKGFVHDESATGQTVYLEPAEVLDLNNEVRELEYEEKREITRILVELTDKIRPNLTDVKSAFHFLGTIDFIRAKAKLGVEIKSENPKLIDQPHIQWVDATHPLLFLAHTKNGKSVVPLSINLEKDNFVLIISGPNAGGKSVCLKTVALLQYMLQCGMPVPVAENSEMGLFKDVFIDIGDEQSIENDLSTYSSHLSNMRHIVEHANSQSLYLIDEFGTGTDPVFGGAMAEAILQRLVQTKSYGIVTTHYGNLKEFASKTEGVINGAMRYHVDEMRPLYDLVIGKPGSSFALEIATNIGIQDSIIERAKELLGDKQVNFEGLIIALEKEKEKLSEEYNSSLKKNAELENSIRVYERNRYDLESQKRVIINAAKNEAKRLLDETNKRIENTIRTIKENKAEKVVTAKVRENLKKFETHLKPKKVKQKKVNDYEIVKGSIVIGDFVKIKNQSTIGKVVALNTKEATLEIGSLRSIVKLNRLEKISKKEAKAGIARPRAASGIDFNRMKAEFKSEIDLRGMRVDEVFTEVDTFIDQALLVGLSNLRIIHGRGTGVLREVIRRQLMTFKEVESVQDEHEERGGSGVTCISLK